MDIHCTFVSSFDFRFGFKLWALAAHTGHLIFAEPYCGSSTDIEKVFNCQGPDVVAGLCEKANVPAGSEVHFDNLFTTLPLLDWLSEKGNFFQ